MYLRFHVHLKRVPHQISTVTESMLGTNIIEETEKTCFI